MLSAHARATNRDIARQLGVSEPTVATRIRQLQASSVIRIVLQRSLRDAVAAHSLAMLDIHVDDADQIEPVARAISAFSNVLTLYETSRRPELVAHIHAPTPEALSDLILTIGEQVEGLSRLTVCPMLSVKRSFPHIGNLSTVVSPPPLSGESPRERLLALLTQDARQSTTALARAVELSETNVRHHVRMLEREGYRAVLVCDAQAMGYNVWTELRVTVAAQHLRSAMAGLEHIPDITVVAHIAGSANLMIFFSATGVGELDEFVRRHIRVMPGMVDFAIMRIPRVFKADYNIVI